MISALRKRYDWRALRRRVRQMCIAPDKQAEGRAILAEIRRIIDAASQEAKDAQRRP